MLPSTGYFKGINCPFYDSGLCERPYCHFRHVKKEPQNTNSDSIESGAILQKLVSAAVQRVLQQSEPTSTASNSKPEDATIQPSACHNAVQTAPKATYNPTPIAELNKLINSDVEANDEVSEQKKRHIPVPYTPRKPASTSIKRTIETEEASKPFIYIPPVKYSPGCTETAPVDQYTPKGSVESNNKYLPGSEVELQEYAPKETQSNSTSKLNYIPSGKNGGNKKKILEYKPVKVSAKSEVPSVTYQPTPRSLVPCFSSDEDEPVNKKRKLSSDLNGLDDFGPEFDILDQILDEEKSDEETESSNKKQNISANIKCKSFTKETKVPSSKENTKSEEKSKCDKIDKSKDDKYRKNSNDKHKSIPNSKENTKSEEKSKCDKIHKSKDKYENNSNDKNKSIDKKKLNHKSHHRDKSKKEEHIHKESSDKKLHSSSKRDSIKRDFKDKTKSVDKKHSDKNSSSKPRENKKENLEKNDRENKKEMRHKLHKSLSKHKSSHKNEKKHSSSKGIECDFDHNAEDLIDNEEISESDEEAIALECKKIFEEYVPIEKPVKSDENVEETVENEYVPGKQRISRTIDKNIKTIPKPALKPDFKVSAAQAMAERLSKIKEYHASKNGMNSTNKDNLITKTDVPKSHTNPSTNSKIRIAHVPYASTLFNAKKGILPNTSEAKNIPSTSTTITQSNRKGVQRVAHIPNEKFIDRPGVLEPLASKIPPNIRSTYLNMMIDECLKIYLSANDAYARAQYEELTTSKKCSAVQIYKNSAVLAVSRLRKELQECKGEKKSGMDCSTLQKNCTVSVSKSNESGSWSIENKKPSDITLEFKGSKFYSNIQKWILTEDQLKENGFPRVHPNGEKGRAIIYSQRKQIPPKGLVRTCCRCKKNFTVDKKGFPVIKEDCIYHPNNKYRMRGEVKYQCCSQDGTSDGCCTAPTHVYEYVDYENLKGFVRTLPPDDVMSDYGVYSLDCEMCYTTQGLDLTRITVINSSCKVVYETLIKPLHPIIDYNTRYSGITEEQMEKVKTTLLEVQATLLSMFNSKTILIGHSLESDFKALKLIHDTVIDTSVLFPHKMGPPYKRALRNLSSELLRKIIQNNIEGHDSAEDATVCMELIHYKLKEFLKTR